jgi:hypothetical protein
VLEGHHLVLVAVTHLECRYRLLELVQSSKEMSERELLLSIQKILRRRKKIRIYAENFFDLYTLSSYDFNPFAAAKLFFGTISSTS